VQPLNFSLSENFLVRKISLQNHNFGLKITIFGEYMGKVEILSIHISFVRNLQLPVENCNCLPPNFLSHDASDV